MFKIVDRAGLIVAASLVLLTAPALGKPTQTQIAAIRASCQSDYRANCAGVPTGGSAALACLQKNLANLSPGCQQAVNAASSAPAPAAAAPPPPAAAAPTPAAAVPAAAPSAPPTPAAPAAAAPAAPPTPAAPNFPRMSPREEFMVIRMACGPDYQALCAGERPGGGRIAACLRANAASLSGACKAALMRARR